MVVVELLPYDLVDNWMPNFMTSFSLHAAALQVHTISAALTSWMWKTSRTFVLLLTSEEKGIVFWSFDYTGPA